MSIIRILKPSIDDTSFEGNPCLRGVIHPASLQGLMIDHHYQREFLNSSTRRYIMQALSNHQRLPDVEIGMRGEEWTCDGDDVILNSPCYLIDGQQRRGSILEHIARFPNFDPRIGAIIHFNSTMEWERERFQALNLHQTRVSSAIVLRNMRSTCPGIAAMYGLSVTDPSFPLYNRVAWGQTMAVKDLINATSYLRIFLTMHGHFGGGIAMMHPSGMPTAFDRLEAAIGLAAIRRNAQTLWKAIDDIWGVKDLTKKGAPWTRHSFLMAFVNLISDHHDFWEGEGSKHFVMPVMHRTKLEKFPIMDPEIRVLCASAGAAVGSLQIHLGKWLNRGRQSNFIQKRNIADLQADIRAQAGRRISEIRKGKPGKPRSTRIALPH